jgi:hypothetical protein
MVAADAADAARALPAGYLTVGTQTNHLLALTVSGTPRLSITTKGEVGIATTAPKAPFHVWSDRPAEVGVLFDAMAKAQAWVVADGGARIEALTGAPLTVTLDRVVTLAVTKEGNLGIGTMAVDQPQNWGRVVDVFGDRSARLTLRTRNVDAKYAVVEDRNQLWSADAGLVIGTTSDHPISLAVTGQVRMAFYRGRWPEPLTMISRREPADKRPVSFLDLYQAAAAAGAPTPPVQPISIRFIQDAFWSHRIEAFQDGIHILTGDLARVPPQQSWLYAAGVNTTSDLRLKDEIVPLSGALETVRRMRGVTFRWKHDAGTDPGAPRRRDLGLIAQDVEVVVPEAVHTGRDGYKSLDYAKLTAVLVEAIKEQQADLAALREEVAALRGAAN